MPEDWASSWYVVENPKTDHARVIGGPFEVLRDARSLVSENHAPARATLGIRLITKIRSGDYEIDWTDGVDQPPATDEQSNGGHTHA